jgi:transposase-like protein
MSALRECQHYSSRSDPEWQTTIICHDCGRYSRDNPQPNGYPQSERETILRAYDERSSLRGLSRTFGVSRNTVTSWLKKREETTAALADTARARRN